MRKIIITYNDIIELNHLLEEKNIKIKVHLHDTCGNQSFTVELLSGADNEVMDEQRREITEYFKNKGSQIQFTTDGLGFYVI